MSSDLAAVCILCPLFDIGIPFTRQYGDNPSHTDQNDNKQTRNDYFRTKNTRHKRNTATDHLIKINMLICSAQKKNILNAQLKYILGTLDWKGVTCFGFVSHDYLKTWISQ